MDWIGPPSDLTHRGVESLLRRAFLAIGFWGAIVLPLTALPALVVLPASADILALVLLANVVCLVVGQRHDPDASRFAVATGHHAGESS